MFLDSKSKAFKAVPNVCSWTIIRTPFINTRSINLSYYYAFSF